MTGYLPDTSILIDLGSHRLERHPRIRRWFEDVPVDELHTCTIVIGELARGIAAPSDGPKRRQQEHHLNHVVLPSFRILPFDLEASLHWGAAMGEGQRIGTNPPLTMTRRSLGSLPHEASPSRRATFVILLVWAYPDLIQARRPDTGSQRSPFYPSPRY